jgi:hypothetical protein
MWPWRAEAPVLAARVRVQVNVSTDPTRTVDISEGEGTIVDYTYSVKWRESATPFERRMDKYSRYSFLPQHLEVRLALHACSSASTA